MSVLVFGFGRLEFRSFDLEQNLEMDFTLLNFHFISQNLETLAASAGRNFGDFSRLMKLSISTSFLTVMRSGLPSGVSTSQVTIPLYKHVPTILAPRSQVPNHPR